MIQQHGNLLQIHHRIQVKVEEQGDHAFAGVLGNCMATARGEHVDGDTRPFHKLLLQDYVKTGLTQAEATTGRQNVPSLSPRPALEVLPHDVVLNRVKTLLQQDARRLDDQRSLQALANCEAAVNNNPYCLMFQLRAAEARTKQVPAKVVINPSSVGSTP